MSIHRTFVFNALLCGMVVMNNAGASQDKMPRERFDVLHFAVDGNSVLGAEVIERALYAHMGPSRTLEDVDNARKALEDAYRTAGYSTVFVDIPEQQVTAGTVRLLVTEGHIARVAVTGSRYFSLGHIRAEVPALAEGTVPHMPTVQRQLTKLAAASPDRVVTPVLRAGKTPGTVESELKVDDTLPLHGSIELNTRNSANTSRLRLIGALRYDNLWQRFHSASLQYQTAPEAQDVEVWAGTYVMPLGESAWRMALYGVGVNSASDVAGAGALAVVGTGTIFGARLVRPFAPLGPYAQSVSVGVDRKDFGESIVLVGADTQNSPITYLPFTARYDGTWRHDDEAVTTFGLEMTASIRGVGNDQQEFENRRFLARSNFIFAGADLMHQRALPWRARLIVRAAGQFADSPLISNEQFAAGGADTVRGYHETEALGDHGIRGTFELQSMPWNVGLGELRGLVFVDGARLRVKNPLPDTPDRYDLASVGFGVRFESEKALAAALDWAYPLTSVETVSTGDQRVHVAVTYDF